MTNVLVLVDHVEGELKNTTLELITAARAFGTCLLYTSDAADEVRRV